MSIVNQIAALAPEIAQGETDGIHSVDRSNATENEQSSSGSALQTEKLAQDPTIEAVGDQLLAEADLQAQQDMVFWATLMFAATVATVIITAIGVWFVKRTLQETMKAVRETSDATVAMREANAIARESARRQTRAYVSAEDHQCINFGIGRTPNFRCKIYNRGQSPAYEVRITAALQSTNGAIDAHKFRFGNLGFYQSRTVVGPGQWIGHLLPGIEEVSQDTWVGVCHGQIALIYAGVISYRDTFGKRRITTFRQWITGNGQPLTSELDMLAASRGNVAN